MIASFNGALDFLKGADLIRTYQPTSRIPNGRVWGPFPMDNQPAWQWRFIVTRDPTAPEMFSYVFEVQPIGAGDVWTPFIDGAFVAAGGVRKGMGHFHMGTDALRAAQFPLEKNAKGELLKDLDVMYWTAAFPVSVTMTLVLYPDADIGDFINTTVINYHHEAEDERRGADDVRGHGLGERGEHLGRQPVDGERPGAGGRDGDGRHDQRDADRVLGRLVQGDLQLHALAPASSGGGDGQHVTLPCLFSALAAKTTLWTKGG